MASANVDLELQVKLHKSVDEAWELIATGDGLSSWFVPTTVIPESGGSVTLHFSEGCCGALPIVVWDPPNRIRFGAAENAPGRAHDFSIVEHSPGVCIFTLKDSGVEAAQQDVTRAGWAGFLANLELKK
ncbi:MAG: hypothetical protein Q8P67_20765 [archaeon]|nr:hypothetical protein [archaeon]